MKPLLVTAVSVLLFSCGSNTGQNAAAAKTAPVAATTTSEPAGGKVANTGDAAIATLDMGNYIFRVHEIIQYHPKEMQANMLKLDDSKQDYYILDCSIENKTGEPINVRLNSLSAYCLLSNNTSFGSMLRGGAILTSYNVDNGKKYPKEQYDLLWSKSFPAGGKARAHLYGVEVPEGVTVTGIGFYEKDKSKNVFVAFNP